MPAEGSLSNRFVLPWWRRSHQAIASGELSATRAPDSTDDASNLINEKLQEWERERNLFNATEVLAAAVICADEERAHEAAQYVKRHASSPNSPILKLANRVLLKGPGQASERADIEAALLHREVARLRQLTRENPATSLNWLDLARVYAVLGVNEKARECLGIARALNPKNRFIVRALARFLAHDKKLGEALHEVKRSGLAGHDPWVASAGIAIEQMMGKKPSGIKQAARLVDGRKHLPKHTAELAAALGTLEMESGKKRRVRELFRTALIDPNENVVAQARWADRDLGDELVGQIIRSPASHEAEAIRLYRLGKFRAAIREAQRWQLTQEFSYKPTCFATYIASVGLQAYDLVVKIVDDAPPCCEGSVVIMNNYALAKAGLGCTDEAVEILKELLSGKLDRDDRLVLTATIGFAFFRLDLHDRGREMYQAAISGFRRRDVKRAFSASLMLCKEELRVGSKAATKLFEYCRDNIGVIDDVAMLKLWESTKKDMERLKKSLR